MNEVIQFFADLLSKAEFWSMSTLGIGASSLFSLLWVRKSNLALTASNILQKGLQAEVASVTATNTMLQTTVMSQDQHIQALESQLKVMNDNLYVLAQAANIGIENKQLIAKNYLSVNDSAPLVEAAKVVVNTTVKEITTQAEEVVSKSSLDELLKKI